MIAITLLFFVYDFHRALHVLLFFYSIIRPSPPSTLFPYTTLFRSPRRRRLQRHGLRVRSARACRRRRRGDRKSTRLNSSHLGISYAVFCLKKKKKRENKTNRNR